MIIPISFTDWLIFGAFTVWLFVLSIVVHELGHYLTMVSYGLKPRFKRRGIDIGVTADNLHGLKLSEKRLISLNGILAGILPILIFTFETPKLTIIYILFYMAATSKDLIILYKGY